MVDAFGTPLGMSIFGALVGNPSSRKSSAIDVCKKAIMDVERFLPPETGGSVLKNPPTIESMCKLMSINPNLLGSYKYI